MAEDGPDIAPVLQMVPRAQTTVKGSPRFCRHRQTVVDESDRTVACGSCGKALDAFQVLLEYARRERHWQCWDQEVGNKTRELAELKDEERKVKARTKNAARKDAGEAVAAERARTEKTRHEVIMAARDVTALGKRIEQMMTRKGETHS